MYSSSSAVFSPFLTVMLFDPQKGPIVTKDLQTTYQQPNNAAAAQGQPYYGSVMVCKNTSSQIHLCIPKQN